MVGLFDSNMKCHATVMSLTQKPWGVSGPKGDYNGVPIFSHGFDRCSAHIRSLSGCGRAGIQPHRIVSGGEEPSRGQGRQVRHIR
ncbi:hypothetical protein AGR5A_Cc170211 [Agrobacterium genomosp. 5 str. CFBP 6626]|nr:hypothetical protein AGR5A_Cc170211 [Agrobacterium genomosp. 5 str. CFBP 6626]